MNQQPQITQWPVKTFVGVGGRFISIMSPDANNFKIIPQLWHTYMHLQDGIPNRVGHIDYGICTTLHPDVQKSHRDELYYVAAAEVSGKAETPNDMVQMTVPAGTYAVFTHYGPLTTLCDTMNYIYKTWLPQSGKKQRSAPDIEVYDERFNPTSEKSEMDIYIPIEE